MAPRGDHQVGQDRHAQGADAGRVAHVEVAFEIVEDAAHRIGVHQGALVRIGREQQFAGSGGQGGGLFDPQPGAMIGQVEVQPAEVA